jgi:opacity protein-like surface antigen
MLQFRISVAVTALAIVILASATAFAGPFYVSTSFGPNFDGESPLPFVKEDTGLVGAVALGTHVNGVEGLRFELEASYRTHDSTLFGVIGLEHDTTAVMANAVYDVAGLAMGRVVPFVLVGAGVAHTELTVGGLAPLTLENDGFGFQLGAGLNYQIAENVSAGVQYRYAEFPEIEIFGTELDGGSNHAIMASVTLALN